jgi:transmembrane sensor
MTKHAQGVRDLIAEEAARWFVDNREGLQTEQQRRAFTAWLRTSPIHVEEYLAFTAVARALPDACKTVEDTPDDLVRHARREDEVTVFPTMLRQERAHPPPRTNRWLPLAVAAALALASVTLLTLRPWQSAERPSANAGALRLQTGHGELLSHEFADHTLIHLNGDTVVTIRFDEHHRQVVLEAGEADFEVVHDEHRPFRVSAGAAQVADVGTRFDVRLKPEATLVTVAEGTVNVWINPEATHPLQYVQLGAGQQVSVSGRVWPVLPVAVDVERATSWLHRQIKFENEPLARVTSEFNRYTATPFVIVTPALQDLKISGVFATDDTDAFIAFLRSLKGVQVDVTASRILVSQH